MKNIIFLGGLLGVLLQANCATVEELAIKGNQYDTAALAELGALLEKEPLTTVEQLTPLAETGNPCAQFYLSAVYQRGMKGINRNEEKAASLITSAAEKGYKPAIVLVGDIYADGMGVPRDTGKAVEFYKKASELFPSSPYPKYRIGVIYQYGGGSIQKSPQEALKWYLQASDLGFSEATLELARLYYNGEGTSEDKVRAFELFNAAADSGNAEAFGMVGYMYDMGEGTPQNFAKSYEYYKKGALAGDNTAARNLSISYSEGVGCNVDQYKAYIWAAVAKALGNSEIDEEFMGGITTKLTKAQITQAQTETASLFASIKAGKFRTQ